MLRKTLTILSLIGLLALSLLLGMMLLLLVCYGSVIPVMPHFDPLQAKQRFSLYLALFLSFLVVGVVGSWLLVHFRRRIIQSRRSLYFLLIGNLAVFALVVSFILAVVDSDAAERIRTIKLINSIMAGLEGFNSDVGRYPTPTEGLSALVAPPTTIAGKWHGPYIKNGFGALRDPWGEQIEYRCPGKYNRIYCDPWSKGPNGIDEHETSGSDDVKNWRCYARP